MWPFVILSVGAGIANYAMKYYTGIGLYDTLLMKLDEKLNPDAPNVLPDPEDK